MDSYPQDLLVGVFPLVFAVNAILLPGQTAAASDGSEDTTGTGGGGDQRKQQRGLFDRFLDAVAASLVEEEEQDDPGESHNSRNRRNVSLFRPDDDEDEESSDDDDLLLMEAEVAAAAAAGSISTAGSSPTRRRGGGGSLTVFGKRRHNNNNNNNNNNARNTSNNNSGAAGGGDTDGGWVRPTSYARALMEGQGFFQRARIMPVSARYGFPPSKDPEGTRSLAHTIPAALKSRNPEQQLQQIFEKRQHALDGILPAGWLDKHVHALPSVVLVVCSVCSSQTEQDKQDKFLYETMEHLHYSLVSKRQCKIHVIGLLQDNVTMIQADEWSRSITAELTTVNDDDGIQTTTVLSGPFARVNLLRIDSDLQSSATDMPTSPALRRLHRTVRDASMVYYIGQARRVKQKLAKLATATIEDDSHYNNNNSFSNYNNNHHHQSYRQQQQRRRTPHPSLLPLFVRYCFEIAMFYEFQLKYESSIRFMTEAYRYLVVYYQYVLHQRWLAAASANDDYDHASATSSSHQVHSPSLTEGGYDDGGGGVEVALLKDSSNSKTSFDRLASQYIPPPPEDMIHQCRAVAEWLNLKVLSSALQSRTSEGLLAASLQWREHSRVFCSSNHHRRPRLLRLRATESNPDGDNGDANDADPQPRIPVWYMWSYVARQRLVMSQLTERYPPSRALVDGIPKQERDEVGVRFSSWRNYEATTEAMLQLGHAVTVAKATLLSHRGGGGERQLADESERETRSRFLGGLGNEGLHPALYEEGKVNHREKAHEFVTRAINLFEGELQREKKGFYAEDVESEKASSRTGARLYYLMGGILLGMGRHQESAQHLSRAARYSTGWKELSLAIRRMLIECYEKHIPSEAEAKAKGLTLASMILDSYFNAEMSSRDLRRALSHFARVSGGESLKWYHSSVDEENASLPFSFAVSFPDKTHATAGETVKASLLIKSNLDYAVHVNSAALLSLAGELPIPTNDLMSAANASEGSEGGIIIQAKTAIIVSTTVDLPKDPSIIATDESGNGGEQLGIAGKGGFAKNARPRSAGLTSAGGARLVSEKKLQPGNAPMGWNLRYLGGKPLRCDGLRLVFYPVQAEKASGNAEKVTLIELTIEKQKPRTAANIRRTPFEEENYIASAWSRPMYLPLSRGPRSLRVLGFSPQMLITNMTEPVTHGKALEGTVNRILLQIQAGPEERCSSIKYDVTCFNVLVTPTGTTKRLVAAEATRETEDAFDMKNPRFRTPVLVEASDDSGSVSTDYGYDLPTGWKLAGSGQGSKGQNLPSLKSGDSSVIHLEFFRPAAHMQRELDPNDGGRIENEDLGDVSLCKTDFYVTVTYKQDKPSATKTKKPKRMTRKRPTTATPAEAPGDVEDRAQAKNELSDEVSLEYSGSIVWAPPLTAHFTPGVKNACPSGSRHPSNAATPGSAAVNGTTEEFALVDGENVTTRCSLELESAMEGLKTDIVAVRFVDNVDTESPVNTTLKSSSLEENILYKPTLSDPCRTLSPGAKVAVSYTVQVGLKDGFKRGGVSMTLGAIQVDWLPSTVPLSHETREKLGSALRGITAHGALAMSTASAIRFKGPPCYVESAPFQARYLAPPSHPKVAVPFEIQYAVENKTGLSQSIQIEMTDNPSTDGSDDLLISGMTQGEVILGPFERQVLSYTLFASKAGVLRFPSLVMTSGRYQTRVVDQPSSSPDGRLYIFP